MKYKKYPSYKDSGVEWLGEVPEHWELSKVSYNFTAKKGIKASLYTKEYCGEIIGEYPVYSGQTENNGVLARINEFEFDSGMEGYLFSTTVGAKAMTLSHLRGKFSLSQNCMIIKPLKDTNIINTRFYFYHKQPLFKFERGLIPEHMQASFRMEDLYQYKICLPQIQEQQQIANFLDKATAKIDTLIEKQTKQIELLKEKRQAVISHAVTKGINPDVKMKDSGVEWLGEIPNHWNVVQSRRLFEARKEKVRKDDEQLTASQKHGVIYQKEFMELEGRRVTIVLTGSEFLKHVEAGDFVISMRSFQGGLELCKYSGSVSSAYVGLIPIKHVVHDYFKYLFKSSTYIQALQSTSNLVRDGQALRFENFSQVDLVIVPEEEQQQIANYLDDKTSKMDKLIEKANKSIELLKEKRTALISACVTGKIDVREEK